MAEKSYSQYITEIAAATDCMESSIKDRQDIKNIWSKNLDYGSRVNEAINLIKYEEVEDIKDS